MDTVRAAVWQEYLGLFSGIMNWQLPFLLFASTIYPDKMVSIVKRKLSLITFLSSCVRICHMWMECLTQCVCQGQINLILKNLFGMITGSSPTFWPKLSRLHVLLSNIPSHNCSVHISRSICNKTDWKIKYKLSLKTFHQPYMSNIYSDGWFTVPSTQLICVYLLLHVFILFHYMFRLLLSHLQVQQNKNV
jgi:hypothetical protein